MEYTYPISDSLLEALGLKEPVIELHIQGIDKNTLEFLDHTHDTLLDGKGQPTNEPHYITVTVEELKNKKILCNSKGEPFHPQPKLEDMA